MVTDRNNMSHAPAGTPGGGRFDGKGAGGGADDVEPPAFALEPPDPAILERASRHVPPAVESAVGDEIARQLPALADEATVFTLSRSNGDILIVDPRTCHAVAGHVTAVPDAPAAGRPHHHHDLNDPVLDGLNRDARDAHPFRVDWTDLGELPQERIDAVARGEYDESWADPAAVVPFRSPVGVWHGSDLEEGRDVQLEFPDAPEGDDDPMRVAWAFNRVNHPDPADMLTDVDARLDTEFDRSPIRFDTYSGAWTVAEGRHAGSADPADADEAEHLRREYIADGTDALADAYGPDTDWGTVAADRFDDRYGDWHDTARYGVIGQLSAEHDDLFDESDQYGLALWAASRGGDPELNAEGEAWFDRHPGARPSR
ncbi:hypothetical protein [Bifidobacterium myosotis]|uniref:Uncharacterized protein n=1 Tax=Bifidobacterium myosotis TaxID=1630166 RepID=A0A5M9ZFY6_9BIFI|nr:hypothetical protein [Bifidobacterium myosotis]KAA8825360.1 hypothetical protein EMO91_12400 [Bifidobacterium myosotis]